jgi:hypothetical protein
MLVPFLGCGFSAALTGAEVPNKSNTGFLEVFLGALETPASGFAGSSFGASVLGVS